MNSMIFFSLYWQQSSIPFIFIPLSYSTQFFLIPISEDSFKLNSYFLVSCSITSRAIIKRRSWVCCVHVNLWISHCLLKAFHISRFSNSHNSICCLFFLPILPLHLTSFKNVDVHYMELLCDFYDLITQSLFHVPTSSLLFFICVLPFVIFPKLKPRTRFLIS